MSAYIVHKATIDLLISAGLEGTRPYGLYWSRNTSGPYVSGNLRHENADEVGRMLWAENVKSIHARYPDTAERDANYPGPLGFSSVDVETYRHEMVRGYEPVDVLKVLDCFEYQACEHKGWESSESARFCQALRRAMISKLPGYDEAPWGIDDTKYFRLREMGA